ncbi:hypothetical protein EN935_10865 [Mesorhizobium sp. M7D.F.Ca.US.004.03.1.1]|jgi:hypothetical protein|uniref:hypothetical protein n=1 Tax=Mesorhizobium sp. M7D.F.Ca.US.004.03.1.1 TaxID=2496702 RepID=UPI000FCA13BB|nr:hypothetical protein [Mesorhizobium sp. M7D.F.Ca.US.004.03.1.1]RVA32831.1 hypothetical protein EN935_10865 [Mesorhizobium sp. M7D.F.Ca.US.004.03.1.1]
MKKIILRLPASGCRLRLSVVSPVECPVRTYPRPDAVVMDIELVAGDCVKVTAMLDVRKIPFVVHSVSFASSGFHDPFFLQSVWITTPAFLSNCAMLSRQLWRWRTMMTFRA